MRCKRFSLEEEFRQPHGPLPPDNEVTNDANPQFPHESTISGSVSRSSKATGCAAPIQSSKSCRNWGREIGKELPSKGSSPHGRRDDSG